MARENFQRVMTEEYKHEGGFVNHPNDPGGATNMGITIHTLSAWRGERVSVADVRNLTRAEANEIYRARYWNVVRGDDLPAGYDYVAMDGAVNSGPRQGAKWLQRGVGAKVDGVVGSNTVDAAMKAPVSGIAKACEARMSFLRGLRHWGTFGRGWSRRVASVEAVATTMWTTAAKGTIAARDAAREGIKDAEAKASKQNKAGKAQAGTAGAAGAGGVPVLDDPFAIAALVAVVAFIALIIILRSKRRENYQQDRKTAYEKQLEEV